jgi:hypothetical protein
MTIHLALATTLAFGCASCDVSTEIKPEPPDAVQQQGLGPSLLRVRTANADQDQLRAFNVAIPASSPNEVIEVIEGPFVVTSILGSGYPLISLDGECPTFEETQTGAEAFQLANIPLQQGVAELVVVPEGALVCAISYTNPYPYVMLISGYVPY